MEKNIESINNTNEDTQCKEFINTVTKMSEITNNDVAKDKQTIDDGAKMSQIITNYLRLGLPTDMHEIHTDTMEGLEKFLKCYKYTQEWLQVLSKNKNILELYHWKLEAIVIFILLCLVKKYVRVAVTVAA